MHKFLSSRVKEDTPAITEAVGHGYATTAMTGTMEYADDILKNLSREFPENLQYVSWRRCTPKEDFHFRIKTGTGSNDIVDIAKATIYLVAFRFRYRRDAAGKASEWVDMPEQFMWMPYCEDTGQFYLADTRYFLVPALADKVLSFEIGSSGATQQDRIFVKLLRDRFFILKDGYRIFVDSAATKEDMESQIKIDEQGHTVTAAGIARDGKPEEFPVTWSYLHHKIRMLRNNNKSAKIKTSLMHYLLARYGFQKTFKTFAGFIPIIGTSRDINRANYPKEEYTLVRSMQMKPRGLAKNMVYTATDVCFAVPKAYATGTMLTMLASFYYIVDWYTHYIRDEWILDKDMLASGKDTDYWRVAMGDLIFNNSVMNSVVSHPEEVNDHLSSVDEYVDNIYVEKFKDIGLDIKTLYQFFGIVIARYSDWVLDPKSRNNTLYDKQLSVLEEVMMPITRAFMGVIFKLKSANKGNLLEESQIIKIFENNLKPRSIHTLTRAINPPMTPISYSGDNKLMNVASTLTVHKAKGKKRSPSMSTAERLHVGMAEVGCFIQLSRSNLTGSTRLNFHVMIDEQGNITRRESTKALLDHVQKVITID